VFTFILLLLISVCARVLFLVRTYVSELNKR